MMYKLVTKEKGEVKTTTLELNETMNEVFTNGYLEDGELNIGQNCETHLCWSCSNGFPSKCPKIADVSKQSPENYEFIKEGYQIFVNSEYLENCSKLVKFVVTKCDKYCVVITDKNNQTSKHQKTKKPIIADIETPNYIQVSDKEISELEKIFNPKYNKKNELSQENIKQKIKKLWY